MNDDVLSDERVGRRVIHGSALRTAGFVAANLLTTVGAVVLLRYLGVEEFGRYGTVMALVGLVQGISDAGLSATGSRELALARSDEDRRDVLAHVLGLRVILTAAGVAFAVVFAILSYDSELAYGTLLAGVGVFLVSVQSAMLLPLSVELRNGMIALNEVLRQFVLAACFVVLAVIGAGLLPFFGAQVVIGIVLLLATPLMLARRQLVAPRWTADRIRSLAIVALPVAAATVLGVVYLRILIVLMSLLSDDADELGYFVTSSRVFEIAGGIPFLVIAVMLPVTTVAARDDRPRLVYMSGRTIQVMTLGGIAIALGLWAAAEPIVLLLGGDEYEPAAAVLQIQAFAAITVFIAAALQLPLFGMGEVRRIALSIAVGIVVVVAAGFALIPPYEAKGAALAVVAGDLALCLTMYVLLRRSAAEAWIPVGGMIRVALAAAIGLGVGLLPWGSDVVKAIATLAALVLAAVVLRAIPSEVYDAARGVLRRRGG